MDKKFYIEYMDNDPLGWVMCKDKSRGLPCVAYKIPHDKYTQHPKEENMKKPGIYFLVENRKGKTIKPFLYIGQASQRINGDSFRPRLGEHDKSNDSCYEKWDWAIAVVRTDEDLNAAELKYLEATFIEEAKKINNYNLINKKSEQSGTPGESDEIMEEFMDVTKNILFALGFDLFNLAGENIKQTKKVSNKNDETKQNNKTSTQNNCKPDYHPLTDDPTSKKPKLLKIDDEEIETKSWKDVAQHICEYLYNVNPQLMQEYANEDYKHSGILLSSNRNTIAKMRSSRHIGNTNIYVETHSDAIKLNDFLCELIKKVDTRNAKIEIYC